MHYALHTYNMWTWAPWHSTNTPGGLLLKLIFIFSLELYCNVCYLHWAWLGALFAVSRYCSYQDSEKKYPHGWLNFTEASWASPNSPIQKHFLLTFSFSVTLYIPLVSIPVSLFQFLLLHASVPLYISPPVSFSLSPPPRATYVPKRKRSCTHSVLLCAF